MHRHVYAQMSVTWRPVPNSFPDAVVHQDAWCHPRRLPQWWRLYPECHHCRSGTCFLSYDSYDKHCRSPYAILCSHSIHLKTSQDISRHLKTSQDHVCCNSGQVVTHSSLRPTGPHVPTLRMCSVKSLYSSSSGNASLELKSSGTGSSKQMCSSHRSNQWKNRWSDNSRTTKLIPGMRMENMVRGLSMSELWSTDTRISFCELWFGGCP